MNSFLKSLTSVGALAILAGLSQAQVNQVNLVSDGSVAAAWTDPNLVNPWGLAFGATGPLWPANNGTNTSTLYNNDGSIVPLVVTTPVNPTGIIFNPTKGFVVSENNVSAPAPFVFVTESGTLSGWAPSVDHTNAITMVNNLIPGSVYKGCTLGFRNGAPLLYAANFHEGKVDVFNDEWKLVKSFTDPKIPGDFSPFNCRAFGNILVVTYAKADAARHDDVAGPGNGYVDVFDLGGNVLYRAASNGALNSPWGIEWAPPSWKNVGGDLLIGNFGDGWINAFDVLGLSHPLLNAQGGPVVIDGLWAIVARDVTLSNSAVEHDIMFTAGPDGETHGLLGKLVPINPGF